MKEQVAISGDVKSFDEFLKENHLYWIGPRESDIDAVKHIFTGSITFFGNGQKEGYREFEDDNHKCCGNHTLGREQKVDHNDLNDKTLDNFVNEKVRYVKEKDSKAKFYMYNPNMLRKDNKPDNIISQEFIYENYICINNQETMKAMDSKFVFHNMLKDDLRAENLLEIIPIEGKNIDSYHMLCQRFDVDPFSNTRFIVQEIFSSGGAGTHVVSKPRHGEGLSFNHDDKYLCSILQENNVSVNAHIIIFDDTVLLLPPSIQVIRENNKRLMYRGADFKTYSEVSKELRSTFEQLCVHVAYKYKNGFTVDGIKYEPFRGVLGLDAIINGNRVEMLECNNRFQSSSNLLNYALRDAHFKSLQELNYYAFNGCSFDHCRQSGYIADDGADMSAVCNLVTEYGEAYTKLDLKDVPYSNFSFVDSGSNIVHAKRAYQVARNIIENNIENNSSVFALETDGYSDKISSYKAFSHLFRISFKTNITSIAPDGTLRLNENICEPSREWMDKLYDFDPLATKISLLVQGLSKLDAKYRPATNNAIDLHLQKPLNLSAPRYTDLIVNAPVKIKFIEFSPFELITKENGKHTLLYYNKEINDNIDVFCEDELSTRTTTANKIPYNQIAFLSGDRLRVHIARACRFKLDTNTCKFCNMDADSHVDKNCDLPEEDVKEVVKAYWDAARDKNTPFRIDHFLIGGQSSVDDFEQSVFTKVAKTAKLIKDITGTNRIYAMILPPKPEQAVEAILEMYRYGVNEFAFNMEIFDSARAKEIMPGKAVAFSRDDYINALITARYVVDDKYKENVRTMFVAGLERTTSLKQGLRIVIDNGIQPMLSVFRPLPGTGLADALPPSLAELYELYLDVEKWCEEKGIHLGPECVFCQNNTLALPY